MTKTTKQTPVRAGVDTRRFQHSHRKSTAKRYVCDIYDAGSYICNVDGTDYIFCEVLTRKAKEAGNEGAKNAFYRLCAFPAAAVLLYGVRAIAVDTINASGYLKVNFHTEMGEDKFTEVEE